MTTNRIDGGRFGTVVMSGRIDALHFHVQPPAPPEPPPPRRLPKVPWPLSVGAIGLGLLVAARNGVVPDRWSRPVWWLVVALLGLAVAGEFHRRWRLRHPVSEAPVTETVLDRAEEELARQLRLQYDREDRIARIHDPAPLPVRWAATDRLVVDHWRNIRAESDDSDAPLDVAGSFADIAGLFLTLPAQRLVVLGDPGAGKSALVLRLAVELLAGRSPDSDAPVPVILPLASWEPGREGLWRWAAERVAAEHPQALGATADATRVALELIATGRVLPLLDGFDELPDVRRGRALRELQRSLAGPARFVLTSRSEEYTAAVEDADVVLGSAAVVELQPLTVDDLEGYLPRTSRATGPHRPGAHRAATKWDPVLERLRDPAAGDRAARVLSAVLSTPLMVALARRAYSDTRADPRELLSAGRFTTRQAVERHLFGAFLAAVYAGPEADPAGHHAVGGGWRERDARRWLGYLARWLEAHREQDIVWWRLDRAVPRVGRACTTLPVVGLVALACWVGGFGTPKWYGATGVPVWAAVALCGVAATVADWVEVKDEAFPPPRRLRLPTGRDIRTGLRARRVHACVTLPALVAANWWAVDSGELAGTLLVGAFTLLLGGAFLVTALRALRRRADPSWGPEPVELLRRDRRAGLCLGWLDAFDDDGPLDRDRWLPMFTVAALAVWQLLGGRDVVTVDTWLVAGVPLLLAVVWYGLMVSAWGRYSVARLWLAAAGRLPLRLMSFLRDAHRHGVLRQTGGTYRFRHLELQRELARDAGGTVSGSAAASPPAVTVCGWRRLLAVTRAAAMPVFSGTTVIALLAAFAGGAFAAPVPAPHRVRVSACDLLPDGDLQRLMRDPVALLGRAPTRWSAAAGEHSGCTLAEQHPFAPDVWVNVLVSALTANLDESGTEAATRLFTSWAEGDDRRPVGGLGDRAAQWDHAGGLATYLGGDAFASVLRGDDGNGTQLLVRDGNVLVRLTYFEAHATQRRATEVGQILMRTVLRRAGLGTGDGTSRAPMASRRSLADVPAAKVPKDTLAAAYRRWRPRALYGAQWRGEERSHLWYRAYSPLFFRAPRTLECALDHDDPLEAFTCETEAWEGVTPRLKLSFRMRGCEGDCADAEVRAFQQELPGYRTTDWRRADRWAWYAASPGGGGRPYRMTAYIGVTYRGDQYLVWVRAETADEHAELAQKVLNDIYTHTRG